MNINQRAQTEPGWGPWRPRRPPGCRCEVVLGGMWPGCGPGLQEPPSLSVAHAGSARHVPDTQAVADAARARLLRSCCPCEGKVQRPGPAYWVAPSGDRTEKTEQGPRAETVCVVRKRGPPSEAPLPGLSQVHRHRHVAPGDAPVARNGQSQSLSRVWNGGQGRSQWPVAWTPAGLVVSMGQSPHSARASDERRREEMPVMRKKPPKPVWPSDQTRRDRQSRSASVEGWQPPPARASPPAPHRSTSHLDDWP